MSMAGSHSSRATRKEYESTQSLYGIPEESGWSIPMPAIHSAQTRSNVHAVFYTLAYTSLGGVQEETETPDIGFQKDEFMYDAYFSDRTGTMLSDDTTRADGNMGELAEKLEDLDDFFDDGPRTTSEQQDGALRNSNGHEEREEIYHEQTLPILHHSLQRNASVTSFQGGFASSEPRYPPTHKPPVVMTPGAFALPTRPGLHNRSVTTPALMTNRTPPRLQNDLMSGDEAGDEPEPFSDDDLSIGRATTADEPQQSNKSAGIRGWKQGLRRLTSSSGGRQDLLRTVTSVPSKSPRVPKVPQAWLQSTEP